MYRSFSVHRCSFFYNSVLCGIKNSVTVLSQLDATCVDSAPIKVKLLFFCLYVPALYIINTQWWKADVYLTFFQGVSFWRQSKSWGLTKLRPEIQHALTNEWANFWNHCKGFIWGPYRPTYIFDLSFVLSFREYLWCPAPIRCGIMHWWPLSVCPSVCLSRAWP